MPVAEGFVTTSDGIRLYFQKLGTGARTIVVPNGPYLINALRRLSDHYTLILYDVRNRGRSDAVADTAKLQRGILNDVDDLEVVRRHFGIERMELLAHSYASFIPILYAIQHSAHVSRIVLLGPVQPDAAAQYPAHLTNIDATLRETFGKLGALEKERTSTDAAVFAKKWWSVLRILYVFDLVNADKLDWVGMDAPDEKNFMKYWNDFLNPSIRNLALTRERLSALVAPVLIVHGNKDRSAAYGGGRDWAHRLPNARLVTVENAAHAPWIEAPELVFESIEAFLAGDWPTTAAKVESIVD